jgi:hypothetical protein
LDEQRTRLLELISEDQFEDYLEEGLADCEAAIRDGVAQGLLGAGRRQRGADRKIYRYY